MEENQNTIKPLKAYGCTLNSFLRTESNGKYASPNDILCSCTVKIIFKKSDLDTNSHNQCSSIYILCCSAL